MSRNETMFATAKSQLSIETPGSFPLFVLSINIIKPSVELF